MAVGDQAADEGVAADAVDRRLARGIDIGDGDDIGVVEAGAELGEEVAEPRVAVRLVDGDDPALGRLPRGLQDGGDLDRVVAVIVDDA